MFKETEITEISFKIVTSNRLHIFGADVENLFHEHYTGYCD